MFPLRRVNAPMSRNTARYWLRKPGRQTVMAGIVFERHHGEHSLTVLEDIADLYSEIHEQEPYDDPIFSRESFIARTSRQAEKTGFELLTARKDNELAGFSFGYTMPAGGWWEDATPPQHNVLGSSKFAVIELDVA